MVKFNSIEPFVPGGSNFQESRQLFLEIGFSINWESGGFIGFQREGCKFILQDFHDKHFAENLMLRMTVSNLDEFWKEILAKKLDKKFKIKLKEPTQYPYGREMHLIDIAGVCWHIAQEN